MKLTTLQWNIGGGRIREPGAEPTDPTSYHKEDLSYIIDTIKKLNPDIITLQETHADNRSIQAKQIAEQIGYFSHNDTYADSHLADNQQLGQAIISRFPINNERFELFKNPRYRLPQPDGSVWVSHDKGISKADLKITETVVFGIATLHLFPFRKFGVDPLSKEAGPFMNNISAKMLPAHKTNLIQGDFNINEPTLTKHFPELFKDGIDEVVQLEPTTPRGRRYDHILYSNLELISSDVVNTVLTDHFPVVSQFNFES